MTPPATNPSAALAEFVTDLEYGDVPPDAVRTIERAYLDTVGVTLAGIAESAGATAADAIGAVSGGTGEARIAGRPERATVPDAGFVTGTAAHCLDFDDWADPTGGHPSVALVPTALAVAETVPVDGRAAITAYLAGFETMAAILPPVHPAHYEDGWHTTGTIGAFGATAAAASLLDLSTDEAATALNVAASTPSGVQRNFGTMTKPLHVGHAVRSGITAALLAREGFSAADEAIAGDDGFWAVYSGAEDPDESAFADPRDGLTLPEHGLHTKRYPSCGGTHPAIAATQSLRSAHEIGPDDVERIDVTAAPAAGDALRFEDPETGFQGKFSMPYAVACAIVHDAVDLESFTDDAVDDPVLQRVRERVHFDVDRDLPYQSTVATVRIRTAEETYEKTVDHAPGSPQNPMSDAAYRRKFRRCSTRAIDRERAEAAADFLESLSERDDLARVLDWLSLSSDAA